jgi:hypothetical protein
MTVTAVHDVTDPSIVGQYVYQAKDAVRAADPGALLEAVGVLLQHDNWKHYVDPIDGEAYDWRDFRRFVEKKLETTVERLIGALPEAPKMQARILELASAPTGVHSQGVSNTDTRRLRGTSAAQMRRLLRDRPDLAERVEANELSVHAAAIEAGFRKPTATIPVDTPDAAINALLRRFSRDELLAVLK